MVEHYPSITYINTVQSPCRGRQNFHGPMVMLLLPVDFSTQDHHFYLLKPHILLPSYL